MITVTVERNPKGKIIRFTVKGHAGYDEAGRDIICAAASATSYTAIGWFEEKYNPEGDEKKRSFTEKDGLIRWKRPEPDKKADDQADNESVTADDAVLEAMLIGFKQIEYSYGKKYLVVKD
jgi:uncharacterized protein YsxB (DUF464 family)